jgi:hypothetical protein
MKKASFFVVFNFLVYAAIAQVPDLKVIASAGTSYQVENFQLDWTLGEPVILTLENPTVILTQGFHQPTYELISAVDFPEWTGRIYVFPNPVSTELNIRIEFQESEEGVLELIDMAGQCVWKDSFSGKLIDKNFQVSGLTAGQYHLNATIPLKHAHQNFSIIKI